MNEIFVSHWGIFPFTVAGAKVMLDGWVRKRDKEKSGEMGEDENDMLNFHGFGNNATGFLTLYPLELHDNLC